MQRLFFAFIILAPKVIFVNPLNSGAVTKSVVSGILLSIYVAFVLRAALVARLEMTGISVLAS